MGKYFGTDGFRGKAGVDLTAEHAFQVGRFLGWYYSQKHTEDSARIVIGKDTRRSSYILKTLWRRVSPPPARTHICSTLPPLLASVTSPVRRISTAA